MTSTIDLPRWLAVLLVGSVVCLSGRAEELTRPVTFNDRSPIPSAEEMTRPSTVNFVPDPASVVRFGPAYRYPQAGWIMLRIEGAPYERGYQHGQLLSKEIVDYIKAIASARSPKAPTDGWNGIRLVVNSLFLRKYDREYLQEMKGIADGAAAAGAKFDDRPIDLLDIATINSDIEFWTLHSALDATATGLETERFKEPPYPQPKTPAEHHCSAFAATGPATADGKIVFGHITMFSLQYVRHFNVWLDLKPTDGHRIVMQTFPGGIHSGLDYYINDAGLLVAETTIHQTRFNIDGASIASRIRKALQYSDSIDQAVKLLREANNGLYTNEWMLADTKTNEIAMFELGTGVNKLWRSGNDEWVGGTKGFYWGCNNAKDLNVRKETVPSLAGKPANLVFCPSDRDRMWLKLHDRHKGKISADFGFLSFTTPPLAGFPSCDAKFTTTDLAKEMKSWALFGPPLGRTWEPTAEEKSRLHDIRPLVANDWALLRVNAPAESAGQPVAADLARDKDKHEDDKEHQTGVLPAAWRGSLLPKGDADTWLAAAFADYEPIVALEKSLVAQAKDKKLSETDKERLALALFAPRSRYLAAVERFGRDIPLTQVRSDLERDEWYQIAAGKGVLLLAELRKKLGDEEFEKLMDDFGQAHAGREVEAAQFVVEAKKASKHSLDDWFEGWLNENSPRELDRQWGWSINSFETEPEQTLIVYGTLKERHAQREAAENLQRQIIRRWSNFSVPIKSDREVTDAELKSNHLLLIGRPDSNRVLERTATALPITFGSGSFAFRGKTYAHPESAVLAAGSNPLNPRYSLVACSGLSAEATWHCVSHLSKRGNQPAPVLLLAHGAKPKPLTVPPAVKAEPAKKVASGGE